MTRAEARARCLAEAARVVDLHGPGVHELAHVAEADGPLMWDEARRLAVELREEAERLCEPEPVQVEMFATWGAP